MKAKNIILILAALALLGVGTFFLQKDKQKKSLAKHHTAKFIQLRKAAEKSSIAGVVVMASAINKFHKDRGRYPGRLLELHPDFISDKLFISELSWEYSQTGKTYLLKRRAKGQKVAVIGPELKLKLGSGDDASTKMVASVSAPAVKKPEKKIVAVAPLAKPGIKPLATQPVPSPALAKAPDNQSSIEKKIRQLENRADKTKKQDKPEPVVTVVKTPLSPDEQFLLSFTRHNFYIWKNMDGVIGFSNIQYPDDDQVSVFENNNWIKIIVQNSHK